MGQTQDGYRDYNGNEDFYGFMWRGGWQGGGQAWIQVGLQTKSNYLTDDGSARIRKRLNSSDVISPWMGFSIPKDYFQDDK